MKAINTIIATMLFLVLVMPVYAQFSAPIPLTLEQVKVDDTELHSDSTTTLSLERGQEYNVRVQFTPFATIRDAQVRVSISGYEFSDITNVDDQSPVFDADTNVTYVKKLKIRLPIDVQKDNYQFRVEISDRNNHVLIKEFSLKIDVPRNSLAINDIVFNPGNAVRAGSALLATVRLENTGEKNQNDVRVTATIPALGVSGTQYINKIQNNDQQEQTEEIFLRIPKCTKPGTYDINIDVEYLKRNRKISDHRTITVLEDDTCADTNKPATTVSLGTQMQSVLSGQSAVFPVTVTNAGRTSKVFTLAVQGVDWAQVMISPTSALVVPGGQTQTVFINVVPTPDSDPGAHTIIATVSSDNQVQQLSLTTNVIATKTTAAGVLEVVLIVLVALLVVLAIVIGIVYLRSRDQTETYY